MFVLWGLSGCHRADDDDGDDVDGDGDRDDAGDDDKYCCSILIEITLLHPHLADLFRGKRIGAADHKT